MKKESKYGDVEKLYRYCLKWGLNFTYSESKEFISVLFGSKNKDANGEEMLFSYSKSKTSDYTAIRVSINLNETKEYKNVDKALKEFEDYDLLRENNTLY